MDFYSNFILIIAILLLLNIWFFDKSRNASIGFRTKRSLSSKKNWVYSQTIFYGGIVLISLLSSTLYSLNIIDVSTSNSISIIGILISAIITQLLLVFEEKSKNN
ncbi:SdpI family protein [Enterococcus faecium]|uniref:SdpI family protein n=1 Tax=Enterococcus faecium TaxID=1352 RepID=UPI00201AB501|nr:SdpI family protein [Enterococcus faecium]MCL4608425.1 SdpI family protein [Enterococcus faecium]MCL4613631.1 SdpI family protein [Enterococcus faecium]